MPAAPRPRPRSCIGSVPDHRAQARRSRTHAGASVAQAEGISERYLQKLFEGTGSNFTHYLRERRLQRSWADLSNPAEAHHSISEIAYRYGFNDSAHFSRAFRDRFGLSPREFRQQEAERAVGVVGVRPASAAGRRTRWRSCAAHHAVGARSQIGRSRRADQTAPQRRRTSRRHHHLPVEAARVHWGYFSRSLQPQIEIAFGRHDHHRNADAARLRRSRADDRGRSRRRERVSLDARRQERRSPRRRPDGRVDLRPWRRRRFRRPHLHRADRGQGRAARRRAGSSHPRHRAAPEPQSRVRGPGVRQQRRGMVGLSLRGISRRAEAARGGDDLRDLRSRATSRMRGRSIPIAGSRRPIRSASCTRPTIIPAFPLRPARSGAGMACSTASAFRCVRISA